MSTYTNDREVLKVLFDLLDYLTGITNIKKWFSGAGDIA